jgi:hypothetical protein
MKQYRVILLAPDLAKIYETTEWMVEDNHPMFMLLGEEVYKLAVITPTSLTYQYQGTGRSL